MNVYFGENREQLRGELVLRWVLRSDLAPVPRTVEIDLQSSEEMERRFKVGQTFETGYEMLKYRVVKVYRMPPTGAVQGDQALQAMRVTALLDSCAKVSYRLPRAIVQTNQTLGAAYRACGASVMIGEDFTVPRFSCFRGMTPSFEIAKALQEEAAALVLRNKKVSVVRLADLFKQKPRDEVGQFDSTGMTESEFLERHEIPAFFSTDDSGQFVGGAFEADRAVEYWPRTDERVLRNMSRVLVRAKVIDSSMCQQVVAGDMLQIMGRPYVVMTAAHEAVKAEGTTDTRSRLWLGVMNK